MRSTSPTAASRYPNTSPLDQPDRRHRRVGKWWSAVAAAVVITAGAVVAVESPTDVHKATGPGYGQDDLRRDTEAIQALGITGVQARVSTVAGRALLGGALLRPAQLAEMRKTVPVNEEMQAFWPHGRYGLGLANRPLSCGGSYWSHEGGNGGYITLNGATDGGGRTVTVSMSTALGDSPDNALRQEKAASSLVDHALCGPPGKR
jgi:hypothetical protein